MFYSQHKNHRLDLSYRYKIISLVFMGTILGQMGIDLYTPSMPMMRFVFHTSRANIQLSLATYMLGYGALQLIFGYCADKFGRRPTLLVGYLGFFIATLLILRTHNIFYFLLLRFFQGGSAAAFQVMLRTSYRDLFSGIELSKVSGYYSTLWALIPILAPALGGYIQHYFNWHVHFELMLGLCTFFFVLTLILLPETKPKSAEKETAHFLSILRKQMSNYEMLLFAMIVALIDLILFAYIAIAPFLLQGSFLISPIVFGWLMLTVAIFSMLGAFITGKFVDKIGERKLIVSMSSLMALTLLCMLLLNTFDAHNLYFILIPIAVIFFTNGVLYPAIAGKAYAAIKSNVGIGVAIYGTIYMTSITIGVGIVSLLSHATIIPFIWLALSACFLIIIILIYMRKKR